MERIYLNDGWLFAFDHSSETYSPVRIPHTVKETPFNYFSEEEYQTVSGYRRALFAKEEWRGRRVLLSFEGVAHYAEIFVNGERLAEHYCGYTAFTLDISDILNYGEENLIFVKVDSRESLNAPPFGRVIDYMTYGGIYRDVYIDVKNGLYISDVFARPEMNGRIVSDITLEGEINEKATLRQYISDGEREILIGEADAEARLSVFGSFKEARLWEPDSPVLYTLKTELCIEGEVVDLHSMKIGFRKAEFRKDGFYLNEKKLKIRGLNRHQSYPYVGYAMPKSMQRMDADVLKKELCLNAVRTSHYPQSQHFIDRCDEIGLLVFTEIPGWQYIGDGEWQDRAVKNTEEMILQYRNHPSIILWGVRINESPDNDGLYKRTNETAHRLDPTRQTGGVRNFRGSNLLEDVYTYNDFIHNGRLPGCEPKANITSDRSKPYMVTEYCGHMYPTKSFDSEDHRVEHAIRHARVLNAIASHSDISGSFGWCMADYNTHKDFGSGDRVCYHGVTDMYRNHKLAAAVYSAQGEGNILKVSSSMDIGEHPAGIKGDIWAFSDADFIRVYKNGELIKEYSTKNESFPHLKSSPVLIDDFIGDVLVKKEGMKAGQARTVSGLLNYIARHGYGSIPLKLVPRLLKCLIIYRMRISRIVDLYTKYAGDWGGEFTVYRFDAIKDGRVVNTVTRAPMTKGSLEVDVYNGHPADGDSYDVTALRIRGVDEYGNTLHFSSEPIKVSLEGPLELIGPEIISLKGGMGGLYLKTIGTAGTATVTLTSAALGEAIIHIEVGAEA